MSRVPAFSTTVALAARPAGAPLTSVMAALTVLAGLALAGCAAPAAQPERMVGVLGSPSQAKPMPERKEAAAAPAPAPEPAAVAAATAREATLNDAQASLRAAEAAYARGDWTAAAQGFKSLTPVYPRNGQVWFGLGAASALSGNLEEASAAFEAALRIDPRDARAAYNLSLIRLSQAEVALGSASANSSQATPPVQAEIARLSRELAIVFRRSYERVPVTAAPLSGADNFRMQDPARSSSVTQPAQSAAFSSTPIIPAANAAR